jgi:hypothetical protein
VAGAAGAAGTLAESGTVVAVDFVVDVVVDVVVVVVGCPSAKAAGVDKPTNASVNTDKPNSTSHRRERIRDK